MGKRDGDKKELKRLQLRREVIRVLASDSLAQVAGGVSAGCWTDDGGGTRSLCQPSK